jgi:hypothetical protein
VTAIEANPVALPAGVTPDIVKHVLEEGSPEEVKIFIKDFNRNDQRGAPLSPDDEVHSGEILGYQFNRTE